MVSAEAAQSQSEKKTDVVVGRQERKEEEEEEEGLTTSGMKRRADHGCSVVTKVSKVDGEAGGGVEREFATSSLLKRLSAGEKIDLDSLDGLDDVSIVPTGRHRTTSEYAPTSIGLDVDKNRSLPSTPVTTRVRGKLQNRRRHLSTSDVGICRHRGLLGSFTESALNGRLEPVSKLDGFSLQLAANGTAFSSPHVSIPVHVHFFDLNTAADNFFSSAPVPYLGKCTMESFGHHGYRIPRKGTIQATLFNPQNTVVKVFITNYDVEDMPSHSRTFIRHVWQWQVDEERSASGSGTSASGDDNVIRRRRVSAESSSTHPKHLQHLIHYRLSSDRKQRVHLHTDIRILFSQNPRDALLLPTNRDNDNGQYHLCQHVELPNNPRYSPIK